MITVGNNKRHHQVYMNVGTGIVAGSTSGSTSINNTVVPTKTFLWGATGEQEWTPAITTGIFLCLQFRFDELK